MQTAGPARRATGRNAASMKYDILSALGAHGCAGDKHRQKLVLRLITLIVARYNWIADEIMVGQREMAELWAIDERSVKRDLAKLRELGWLIQKRAAARGRVAVHGLGLARILEGTEPDWARIGPDYVARMAGQGTPTAGAAAPSPAAPSNVISFPLPTGDDGVWPRVQAMLHREDPHLYAAWFAALEAEHQGDCLRLLAPTRFHADYLRSNHLQRLERIARACLGDLARVEVLVQG
jgi:DnaA N-terminal domain